MNNLRKPILWALSLSLLIINLPAQALTVVPGTGPSHVYTFSGSSFSFVLSGFPLTCDADFEGYIEQDGSDLTITLTDGQLSNGTFGLCSSFALENFPWVATTTVTSTATDSPLNLIFTGASITGPLGTCGPGNLPVVFEYVNPSTTPYSTLTLAGAGPCSLAGSASEITGNLVITNP